jgi:hypothetical protein
LGFCTVASLGLAACSAAEDASPLSADEEATGSIDLALELPSGESIDSATYTITGPSGFSRTRAIDVSKSNKISAEVVGIPTGSGYSVTVSATGPAGTCSGSASFSVTAGNSANVAVSLACRSSAKTGSVKINGVLNSCPSIDGIGASPAEVNIGASISLSALAYDSDAAPEALSYAWTASAGTLSSSTAKTPSLLCTTEGTVTVGLTVSDGDPAASCAAEREIEVTCSVASEDATPGTYVAGDIHNHTTCSDGSISMQKLVKKATDKEDTPWGLDWFVQAGHGGSGNRNCTLTEDASFSTPAYPFVTGQSPTTTWVNSGITPQGDVSGSGANRNMRRWQTLQQFQYPLLEYISAYKNLPLFLGVETVNPGHEHTDAAVFTGQMPASLDDATLPTTPGYTALGNADALAQWEYCFDRNDTDRSRGAANNWDCSVPGSANETDPSWNATAKKLIPATGAGVGTRGHNKSLEAVKWMAAFHPDSSYFIPTHLERAGQFNPDGNNGFNVEHLRNFNNAAPRVAFGFETQPGHGASDQRGEYSVGRNNIGGVQTDSVGGTTYGGTGVYGGVVGGVWDALLGEGRNFWFFASSDWHNRGSFGPDDRRSSQDFYPGEYQRSFTLVSSGADKIRAQAVVDGLRSGNVFTSSGQIIDRLAIVVCSGKTQAQASQIAANAAFEGRSPAAEDCATMGQKLEVDAGADLVVGIAVRDPEGTNYSPYTFPNPSLAQIGVEQPLNQPVVDHIDLIRGLVTGYKTPGAADYAGEWPRNTNWLRADGTTADLSVVPDAAKNTSAAVLRAFNGSGESPWEAVLSPVDGSTFLTMSFSIADVTASQYVRLRGTNLPAAVPFETDASGNPLADVYTNAGDKSRLRIPCTTPIGESQFDGCPDHLAVATGTTNPIVGQKAVTFDVAAWSDLWFYSNPVYIEVEGSTVVAGVN